MNAVAETRISIGDSDPTGTLKLQAQFRADFDHRWGVLRRLVIEAFGDADILGLRGATPANIMQTAQLHRLPGNDKVLAFKRWIDEALRQIMLNSDWTTRYVNLTTTMAQHRAVGLTGKPPPPSLRAPLLSSVVASELQGICATLSQQMTRCVAHRLMERRRPAKLQRDLAALIRKIGVRRSRLLVSYAIVKTFSAVTLESLRHAGVQHVGIVPETIRTSLLTDAKKRRRRRRTGQVDVLTAGDDRVCFTCQEISDDGPYSLDEAESLIPAHSLCRCAFVPVDDRRFASVHDFDPDEPRDYHGRWTTGGLEFVSPNVTTLNFAQAKTQLASVAQRNFAKASAAVDEALGLNARSTDVIGAWRDGAENSLMTAVDGASWDQLKVSGAARQSKII